MVTGRDNAAPQRPELIRRTLVVLALAVGFGMLAFLTWWARRILLVGFAGVLLAIFLQTLADWLRRYIRLSYGWSLAVVVLVLVALFSGGAWLVGARIAQQIGQLSQAIPDSLRHVQEQLEKSPFGQWLVPKAGNLIAGPGTLTQVTGIASGAIRFLVDLVVILFVGLYGAAQYDWYLRGLLHLVPQAKRKRTQAILDKIGDTLRWWLLGQLISMAIIGTMTGVGLWLIGAELPLALGVLAFGLEIVPDVGPILAAIPAILLAWVHGPWEAVHVVLLYIGIHIVEGYILMPLVQLRTIRLPPAIHILMVVLLGLLAGFIGILVSAPLLITVILLVRMLYVEDGLGDRSAVEPGE